MRKTYYLLRPSLTIIQIITGEERGLRGLREVGNFVVIVTLSLLVAIQVISAELLSTSCAMNRQLWSDDRAVGAVWEQFPCFSQMSRV